MPLHGWELFIVFALVVLFFGAKRLPEMGSSVGKTIQEFRKSMRETTTRTEETPALPPKE